VKADTMIGAHVIKVFNDVVIALADANEVEQTSAVLKVSPKSFLI
jgi:hypothetical protein